MADAMKNPMAPDLAQEALAQADAPVANVPTANSPIVEPHSVKLELQEWWKEQEYLDEKKKLVTINNEANMWGSLTSYTFWGTLGLLTAGWAAGMAILAGPLLLAAGLGVGLFGLYCSHRANDARTKAGFAQTELNQRFSAPAHANLVGEAVSQKLTHSLQQAENLSPISFMNAVSANAAAKDEHPEPKWTSKFPPKAQDKGFVEGLGVAANTAERGFVENLASQEPSPAKVAAAGR